MKVVILAGGLGTRLREETEYRPKPMVPIGRYPILLHIMKIYEHFEHNEFIVCTGYRGNVVREYIANLDIMDSDFTVRFFENSKEIEFSKPISNRQVEVIETGASTTTGGRVKQARGTVANNTFMCTYGDGLSDVNIDQLLAFHRSHKKIATVTCVRPQSRFGEIKFRTDGEVIEFLEKPMMQEWVNGGFFVFEPEIFDLIDENEPLESGTLSKLAKLGELMAYKHEGFWQPMDTYREFEILNDIWEKGKAPWTYPMS